MITAFYARTAKDNWENYDLTVQFFESDNYNKKEKG